MDFKGTVTLSAKEFLEMVDRIRHLDSELYLRQKDLEKMKEALETAEKKLAEEDDF